MDDDAEVSLLDDWRGYPYTYNRHQRIFIGDEAAFYERQGWSYRSIGRALGLTAGYVGKLLRDRDRKVARDRDVMRNRERVLDNHLRNPHVARALLSVFFDDDEPEARLWDVT